MLNQFAKQWVADLRRPDLKQTTGALEEDGAYCCLGVGQCVTLGLPSEKRVTLSGDARVRLGLNTDEGIFHRDSRTQNLSLVGLNDRSKWTFAQIADFIESDPAGLFIEQNGGAR